MYNFTLKLTKEAANGLRAASAQNDVRYYLNGFAIDLDAKRISATDGHRLLVIPFSNPGVLAAIGAGKGNTGTVIVPRLPRKAPGDVIIHLERGDDAGPVTIFAEYFTAAGRMKERIQLESMFNETFPDIDRVIPADGDCAAFDAPGGIPAFNVSYLADVAAAISPKYQSVRIRPQRDECARTSPFRVEFPESPLTTADPETSITYIVMPIRD